MNGEPSNNGTFIPEEKPDGKPDGEKCKHEWEFDSEYDTDNAWGGAEYHIFETCLLCGEEQETIAAWSYWDDRNWEHENWY